MTDIRPFWIAGRAETSSTSAEVVNPYDGSVVGAHHVPDAEQVERAVAAAWKVRQAFSATTAAQRGEALLHVSTRLTERAEEIAELITAENGKPIRWARGEVLRAASVFRIAAEEARRFSGEVHRLDADPSGTGRAGIVRRFPIGPVLGIAPFNFPLNLVAHKVAPALAVGTPIIVKPAPATPLSALVLGEILAETDLPAGSWSVLPVGNDVAPALVADERLPVVSFTGSEKVGFAIQAAVPRKHVTLELGGNAAAIVCPDWCSDADIAWAAGRIATFATYQGGQSCISVQRVLVDSTLWDRLVPAVVAEVAALATGSRTSTGPKTSSHTTFASDGASTSTVGGYVAPSRVPPTRTSAPAATASSTQDSTRRAAASSTRGPTTVASSHGEPVASAATSATTAGTSRSQSVESTRTRWTEMQD